MKIFTFLIFLFSAVYITVLLHGCSDVEGIAEPEFNLNLPSGFPQMYIPADNPLSASKISLGRHLFFDKRLSRDSTVSCGTCHIPSLAFSDSGMQFSRGVRDQRTLRNSPSLTNTGYNLSFFWEGGVPSLELQALAPILAPHEMDMNTDTLILRIKDDPVYKELFYRAFGTETITIAMITKALASFQRTMVSSNSPFDRYRNGNTSAISADAVKGMELFFGEKGDCFHCHNGFNFTDNTFHNTSLEPGFSDEGRYLITGFTTDRGKFKTPTLRNVELTPPYMHNGSVRTLREVVVHYNSGGKGNPNADILMRPLGLSDSEVDQLVEFLRALTDDTFNNNPAFTNPWQ